MARQGKLTRIELLVIVGLLAYVVIGLIQTRRLPPHRRGARSVLCMANLKEWGLIFSMYTEDNDGCFFSSEGGGDERWWMDPLRQYYKNTTSWLCPEARKPYAEPDHSVVRAWKTADDMGSYGLNGWVCNPHEGEALPLGPLSAEYCWRSTNVENADNVPLFLDAMWFEGWPRHTDAPSHAEDWVGNKDPKTLAVFYLSHMSRFCVDRHRGNVNVMFLDWSVRSVGLKELWTLKWHRNYNVDGPWTKAGGVLPADWPEWMRNFRDF